MNINAFKKQLDDLGIQYKEAVSLAPFSTFKIGGPADILVEASSIDELVSIVKAAKEHDVPLTMLGWGSNVLISDKGIRGVVLRNRAEKITITDGKRDDESAGKNQNKSETEGTNEKARLDQLEPEKYYSFKDLDYDESSSPIAMVKIEYGAGLPVTIARLIRNGLTGLQWFGGIPGTIGGAIYNNIHGGSHFIAEYIDSVEIFDPQSAAIKEIKAKDCEFGYDYSRFHKSGEIILSALFKLYKGDPDKAKYVYQEWTRRKSLQPQKSAGCVWKNLSEKERERLGLESGGWGYIIDKILNLKGKRSGDAIISTKHAAFIENTGHAKAKDVINLMDLIKK